MMLSVIIVSWNVEALLVRCLESLLVELQALSAGAEVWLVDNASTDGTVQRVRTDFPWVRLIENDKNVGFASANNQAAQRCTGEYVLLLNPDTVIKPGALLRLINFMAANPSVGAAGARLLNGDGSLQTSCYPAPTLSREMWRLFHLDAIWPYGSYHMAGWQLDRPRPVDSLLGACIVARRNVLESVGLFDEEYFMFSEEVDLCHRIQRAGWPLYWVPQAEVIHYGGQSTRQVATAMFLHLYQGKLLYFRKNQGWLAAQLYKLILLAASVTRLVLNPLARIIRPNQRQHYLALADHYWRLVLALPGL